MRKTRTIHLLLSFAAALFSCRLDSVTAFSSSSSQAIQEVQKVTVGRNNEHDSRITGSSSSRACKGRRASRNDFAFALSSLSSSSSPLFSPLRFNAVDRYSLRQQRKCSLSLQASVSDGDISKQSSSFFKIPSMDAASLKALFSASLFIIFDVLFRKVFVKAAISFPSSLAGCGLLLSVLLLLPSNTSQSIFQLLEPGAALIGAKWLPVFFVPSLVTLPLAEPLGSTAELIKTFSVVFGGFLFTLLTTAYSVVAVRGGGSAPKKATAMDSPSASTPEPNVTTTTPPPPKPFSDELFSSLVALTLVSGFGSVFASSLSLLPSAAKTISAVFMLSTTLTSFVFGARLPVAFKKVVHPLVTCTALTWTAATALASLTGASFHSVLRSYRTGSLRPLTSAGAGDILLFLLGPAVVSLAISMYSRRKLMAENVVPVATAVSVSTFGGIFGTAMAVRLLAMGNPKLRLALLSRNITSPLAMTIASVLGADVSLAVSMVVVTGLIGANFGAAILNVFGVKDPIARGLGIGAAAHGLGTAAFANEKDAFPFAAIAMALTGAGATVTVSIPFLRRAILQLALGG